MSDPFLLNTDPPKSRAMCSSTATTAFLRRSRSDFVNSARSIDGTHGTQRVLVQPQRALDCVPDFSSYG
jgi:hypothetical protein